MSFEFISCIFGDIFLRLKCFQLNKEGQVIQINKLESFKYGTLDQNEPVLSTMEIQSLF
jgi:hypothetical protein